MSDTGQQRDGEAAFDARIAGCLRDSAENLDAATRSRLNRARQAALAELPGSRRFRPAWAVAATVAIAIVAASLWRPGLPPMTPDPLAGPAPDLELLLAEDMEMLEDLDFYVWLAAEGMNAGTAG